MNLMVMQFDIDKLYHFQWKWPFDSSDPKWPLVIFYTHNFCREGQAVAYV